MSDLWPESIYVLSATLIETKMLYVIKIRILVYEKRIFKKTLVRTAEDFSSGCFCFWISKAPPATLLEQRLLHRCFPVNFAKFLRTPFFTEHLWWLLLGFISWNTFNNQICIKSTYQELKMRQDMSKMEFFATAVNCFPKELHLRGLFDRLPRICFWLRNSIYEAIVKLKLLHKLHTYTT